MADNSSFVWGQNGEILTPEQIAQRKKDAAALIKQGMDFSPIGSWTQGAARVAQGVMGAFDDRSANNAEKSNAVANDELIKAISGYTSAPAYPSSVAASGSPTAPAAVGEGFDPRLKDAIGVASQKYGIDPNALTAIAQVESGGRLNAANPNSSALGPFQFINGTAKQYGLNDPTDPNQSADAAARLTLDNSKILTNALGRAPTAGELYLAHQQGPGGAVKLLANPDAPAINVVGADAVRLNGGDQSMTAGQFANQWTSKVDALPGGNTIMPISPEEVLRQSRAAGSVPYEGPGATLAPISTQANFGSVAPSQPLSEEQRAIQNSKFEANKPNIGSPYIQPTMEQGVNALAAQPQQAPAAQAINAVAPQPSPTGQQQVAQALQAYPIQASARSQDPMVAGADQTLQPAVQQAQQGAPNQNEALIRAITDPRATPQTRAVAQMMMQQAAARQAQEAENQTWMARQQYQQNTPENKLDMEYKQAQIAALGNKGNAIPESVRALNIRAEQAGLKPGTPEYQQFMTTGGRGPAVQVNTGENSNKFSQKSDELAAGRLNEIVAGANSAPQIISDIDTLTQLGKQIGTGKGAQLVQQLGPYASALGIDVKGLDESQAYQSIVERMAPQMRPVGAGSSSDRDIAGYLRSLPNIANQPGGNELIARTFKAVQENKLEAANFASQAQRGDITWQQAEEKIRNIKSDPWGDYKKFQADLADPNKVPSAIPGVSIRKLSD